LSFTFVGGGGNFSSYTTADFTVNLKQNGVAYATSTSVEWSIVSVNNSNVAVTNANRNLATGLAWGASATGSPGTALTATTTSNTNASGNATIQLTDIMGERTVTVRASVTISGTTYTADQSITFGTGPLGIFTLPGGTVSNAQWASFSPISHANNTSLNNFPAALMCGTTLSAAQLSALPDGYAAATKLPTVGNLRSVSSGFGGNNAWVAAGWPGDLVWTGEVSNGGTYARIVYPNGFDVDLPVLNDFPVVCLR